MKLIRSLVFPWLVFFIVAVSGIVSIGVKFTHLQAVALKNHEEFLLIGSILCLFANILTLGGVGIWMSESLPESLRYGSGRWILRAIKAVLFAGATWLVGLLPWVPLIWHAVMIPVVFTIVLFVFVWSLIGPILKWSSNLAWSRAFSVVLSAPILAAVPVTALFLGQTIVSAYRASHADMTAVSIAEPQPQSRQISFRGRVLSVVEHDEMRIYGEWPVGSGKNKTIEVELKDLPPAMVSALPKAPTPKEITVKLDPRAIQEVKVQSRPDRLDTADIQVRLESPKATTRAEAFREIYEFSSECSNYSKEIAGAMDPEGDRDVVYWAVKASGCANLRTVIGLPRLADIMMKHADGQVRAAAIERMKDYPLEHVREISYLLVKRLNEKETPEVIDATATIVASLGEDRHRWALKRLRELLDAEPSSLVAAKALIRDFGAADAVAEHVSANLAGPSIARDRAIDMICMLPKTQRAAAEPHVMSIVAAVKTGGAHDAAVRALDCLGRPGIKAVWTELSQPKQLSRAVAARAMAELNVKDVPEAAETIKTCSRDDDPQVRQWCSQSLGRIGASALPDIMKMLTSNNSGLKDAGRNALRHFEDPSAKEQMLQIVRENSGWMANNKSLQVAKAVGHALMELDNVSLSSTAQ